MALVKSLADGYVTESGVMSATPTVSGIYIKLGVASALINHLVVVPAGKVLLASSITFSCKGDSVALGTSGTGSLGIEPGLAGQVVAGGPLTAAGKKLRFVSVGSVIQPTAGRSGRSLPAGR